MRPGVAPRLVLNGKFLHVQVDIAQDDYRKSNLHQNVAMTCLDFFHDNAWSAITWYRLDTRV